MISWISKSVVLAIHDQQIAEHGGSSGLRDDTVFESALARPQNLLAYGDPRPDLPALAAAYAFGIAKNHAFVDGNKRTSYVVTRTFLILNGLDITATQIETLTVWIQLGAGKLSEEAVADWLTRHTAKK